MTEQTSMVRQPGSGSAQPWAVAPNPSDGERTALLDLAMTVEPGTPGIEAELAEYGAAEALRRMRVGASSLRPSPHATNWPRVDHVRSCLPGVRIVLRGDDEYPSQLNDLDEPPLALWVRGPLDLRLAASRSVAVVGARAASGYGQRVAHELGRELATRDWAVVSGAAFGVDAAAHRGALGAPGPTIGVLACGIDIAYPRAHETLIAAIADEGAMITELPPGSAPLRYRFLSRNRIIAALTRGCVIVEAALRSGAISTANRAHELARPLMAVPGPVDVLTSSGTNRLIHDGVASLVRDADDVTAAILADPDAHDMPMRELPPHAEQVAAVLGRRGQSVAEVAQATDLDQAMVTAMLGLLEVRGWASRGASGWTALDSKQCSYPREAKV